MATLLDIGEVTLVEDSLPGAAILEETALSGDFEAAADNFLRLNLFPAVGVSMVLF